jgi:hypothetical protein
MVESRIISMNKLYFILKSCSFGTTFRDSKTALKYKDQEICLVRSKIGIGWDLGTLRERNKVRIGRWSVTAASSSTIFILPSRGPMSTGLNLRRLFF